MTAPAAEEVSMTEAFSDLAAGIVSLENANDGGAAATDAPATPESTTAPAEVDPPQKSAEPTLKATDSGTKPGPTEPTHESAAGSDPGDDPLKGSKPMQYTVDGQNRTADGVYEYEGGGAVILPDALPRIKDRLQQADRLVEQNRTLYEQNQNLERIGGVKRVEQLTAENAILDTAGAILLRALADPNTLVTLATDPAARQQLIREVQLSAREAQFAARTEFASQTSQFNAQRQQHSQSQTAIGNAVGQLAKSFEGLTAEDVEAVRTHALRVQSAIVRPATPDEARAAGVRPGEPIIDLPTLHSLLSDRHTLRQSAAAAIRREADTTRQNAARLAAAAPTATAAKPNAPRPGAGKVTPKATTGSKTLNEMTSAELTRAMKNGRIFDLMGDDD